MPRTPAYEKKKTKRKRRRRRRRKSASPREKRVRAALACGGDTVGGCGEDVRAEWRGSGFEE